LLAIAKAKRDFERNYLVEIKRFPLIAPFGYFFTEKGASNHFFDVGLSFLFYSKPVFS
jgi:hypothetical protein